MKSVWKWFAVAACGLGLVFAANRLHLAAAENGPEYGESRGHDALRKLEQIVEKLGRITDRMGEGPRRDWPRHEGPGREGPPPRPRHHDEDDEGSRGDHPRWGWGGPPERPRPDMPPEFREMMEQRMREARERMEEARREGRERMEKAREKFRELEDRVKQLESEVAQLKAARQG